MRRKEERSKQGQINNKAKQHSTPKAVTFLKKNELPQVGIEPARIDHMTYTWTLYYKNNVHYYVYTETDIMEIHCMWSV